MLHILNHNDEIVDYFDISDGDILNPDMVRNVETLEDTFEFSVISERSLHVQERNRVIIKDNEGEYREFIIMQYESNIDGFTEVSCVGSHLEDFASAKPFKPQSIERYSTNQAITFLASDTGWELAPDNEWNGLRTTSWSSWKDRLSLLKQLQTTYDMRLSFYIELGTNRVKHRYVKLVEVNPMFNGEEIVYGENMIDLKRSVDFTDVATALIAIGPEDDDGNRLIIEMKDDEAQEQLGLPYRYLWQIYEPESDDTAMTEARLKTLARTKLNKVKAASVTYTIQSTQLDVKVGDMIRVKNEDFTPELYVEAEIIEIKYNPHTKLCDYKFGILTEYTREEVYDRFNKLLETLRSRLANITHNTENIINERFEEELKDLERYIHKSPSAPLNPQEGDLWLDTSHNQVAVLRRYENGEWVKSSVSEAHDINAPTREEVMYQMITERSHRLKNMMLNNFGTFNNLTNQKYYGDLPRDIRDSFSASFTEQSKAYADFERDYNNIHPEQPTIGLIVKAMDTAIRFEEVSSNFNDVYAQIRAAYDSYIELLQRQYSDEKYEEALNEIADKFGLEVVDGKLVGDANFIDNMNAIKDDLQKQLDDARAELDGLEGTEQKITNINQSITNIEGRLESTVNRETFDILDNTVTQQGTLISQTADELKSKADSSRVDTINDTVTQQGTLISQTAEDLKLKANQKDLDTLNNTVSEQGTEITANAQEIALRAKESDLNTVTGRVEKAEADIEVNAREISSRVKEVDYQTDKEGIIGRLSGAESSITQQSQLIETKVSSTELTQAIDDIDIGGVNLANWTETSVENKDRYRPTGRTNDVSIVTLQGEKFTQVRELNGESGVGTVFGIYVGRWDNGANNSYFNIEKDQEYTLTLRGQNSSTTDEFTYMFIMRDDNLENPESTTSGANQGISNAIVDRVNVESGYGSRYKFRFKANWNSKKAYILVGTHKKSGWGAGTSFWFRFKELQLEKGNKATDWSLSQTDTLKQFEDLDDRITTHDTKFEQTDTQLSLKATMTDVNQSDETLSRAISELVIDTANGLKFNYDSNGRLASYSVGKDGIQFDGSKIKFTASDSIMLQIADAKKAGTDAQGVASDAKSKIDNLDLSGTNLVSGTNFSIKENVDRLDTPWGSANYTSESEYLLVLHNNLAENAAYGLRTFRNDFKLKQNAEYTLSFEAYSNVNSDESFSYVYLYRYGASNQGRFTLNRELIGTAGGSTGIGYDLYRYTVTFKNTTGTEPANLLIATRGTGYSWFRIKNIMLTRGDVAVPYNVQGHKMVDTDTLIPSINGDKNGWTISGNKIDLIGDVDMVNGNTRIKNLNLNNATVTGGTGKNTISINNNEIISHGLFTRTWAGVTDTAELNLGIRHGRIMISNENTGYNLYLTEKGLSTTMDGATAGYSAGTLEFHSQRFNETSRGVTLHSTFGTVALLSDESTIVSRSRLTNNIESVDFSVYVRPFMNTRPGTNEFQFYVKDGGSVTTTDGTLLYNGESAARGSGIRFSKAGTPTIYATNSNGDIGSGHFYADEYNGTGIKTTATNFYVMATNSGEVRITNRLGYNSNIVYRPLRTSEIHNQDGKYSSHTSGNTYMGVATGEFRVTDNNFYNGGNTNYKDIKFQNWRAMSHEKYKYDIKEWNLSVLPIFAEELQMHTFKVKSERDTEKDLIHQGIILRENSNDDRFPSEWREGDGFNGNKVMWWTVKGVQELAQENYKKDEIIKEQGAKIEELEKQMSEVMALLNKE